jgi:hypothetical protein
MAPGARSTKKHHGPEKWQRQRSDVAKKAEDIRNTVTTDPNIIVGTVGIPAAAKLDADRRGRKRKYKWR